MKNMCYICGYMFTNGEDQICPNCVPQKNKIDIATHKFMNASEYCPHCNREMIVASVEYIDYDGNIVKRCNCHTCKNSFGVTIVKTTTTHEEFWKLFSE